MKVQGNIDVGTNAATGLTLNSRTTQDFEIETSNSDFSVTTGTGGGTSAFEGLTISNQGKDELITGDLTTVILSVFGSPYTFSYKGVEDDGNMIFTPFEPATTQEAFDQAFNFLNRQP